MPSGKTDRKEGESSGEENKSAKRASPADDSNEVENSDSQDGTQSRRSRRNKPRVSTTLKDLVDAYKTAVKVD